MVNSQILAIINESLNVKKSNLFFQKPSKKDNIPLRLPNLTIGNHKIRREEPIKFLEALLDENLTWKKHLISTFTQSKASPE